MAVTQEEHCNVSQRTSRGLWPGLDSSKPPCAQLVQLIYPQTQTYFTVTLTLGYHMVLMKRAADYCCVCWAVPGHTLRRYQTPPVAVKLHQKENSCWMSWYQTQPSARAVIVQPLALPPESEPHSTAF